MRNDWQASDDDEPKTRADYRRQQEAADRKLAQRDRQRVAVERKYAREHPDDDQPSDDQPVVNTAAEKQRRLGRRLNWAIFWLSLGIIAVFLILRFIEF